LWQLSVTFVQTRRALRTVKLSKQVRKGDKKRMSYVIGVDVGTLNARAGLFDLNGRYEEICEIEYPLPYSSSTYLCGTLFSEADAWRHTAR
jgi:hypothetical protein